MEGIHIVDKGHFDLVVLRENNSSLKNEVGARFIADKDNPSFYQVCVSLGHLLECILTNHSWRVDKNQAALQAAAQTVGQVAAANGWGRQQMEQLMDMAAAVLDFCVDVDPAEGQSEMTVNAYQQTLLELQGRLRRADDELRLAILSGATA